jgi:DNA-binding Lrp family transcriptional regulator
MITAIVFVKADVARIPEVAEAIAAIDGVSEVYSVTGQIDLIALVRVSNHDDVARVVARRAGDRDSHRLPHLLPARPGVGLLARPRLVISGHARIVRTLHRRVLTGQFV